MTDALLQQASNDWMVSRLGLFATREPSFCYAPLGGLHLRQDGKVYACCMSRRPLGDLREMTLRDIWDGVKIQRMRAELATGRLARGCDNCAMFLADGDYHNAPMRYFDYWTPSTDWPINLDFQLSNACNLQCVQCCGLSSSAIRYHREHRPPTRHRYSDDMITAMADFILHAGYLRFSGGEPFLVRQYYTIWDMVADNGTGAKDWDSPGTKCQVTTNATHYHRQVERALDRVSMGIDVSMDGATRETVEAIRVGIDYDVHMANARRFREYTRERQTFFMLSMCLMPGNFHEFGQMCLRADEWECDLNCNFVLEPRLYSVLRQRVEIIRTILDVLEKETVTLEPQLGRNRDVWFTALGKIRARLIALGG